MATKNAKAPEGQIKARVLTQCIHGKPNDVVTLPIAEAESGEKDGALDTNPAAVAYAESIAPKTEAE
jgi:hypothetical protein